MNDSVSTTSPEWPTRWPKHSFPLLATAACALLVALPFLLVLILNAHSKAVPVQTAAYPPWAVDVALAFSVAVETLLAVLVLALLPTLSGFTLAQLGFRKPTSKTVGIAVAGGVLMGVVSNGSASLIDAFLHRHHEQAIVSVFQSLSDPSTVVAFALFAVIFAPFAEETIFRVFFFNIGLRYGGFWAGAVLSGVLFGLAHGDAYFALPLALGGMILCGVYYRTRNAFGSMISHGFFNAMSIAAMLFVPHAAK